MYQLENKEGEEGMAANGKYAQWITAEGLLKIEGWARDGLTDEQIAHNMGIHTSTLYEWKKRYTELTEALKKGKEVVDRAVENALLKRALGYSYTESKRNIMDDGKEILTLTEKEVVPDTTAQIFWLKNRKPKDWRDKQEIETSGETTVNNRVDLTAISTEDLKKMLGDASD